MGRCFRVSARFCLFAFHVHLRFIRRFVLLKCCLFLGACPGVVGLSAFRPFGLPPFSLSGCPPCCPFVCPSGCPPCCPSVRLSVCPPVRPSVRPSACPSVRPSVRPSIRPSVRPSVSPSVRPSMCPSGRFPGAESGACRIDGVAMRTSTGLQARGGVNA